VETEQQHHMPMTDRQTDTVGFNVMLTHYGPFSETIFPKLKSSQPITWLVLINQI